MDQLTSILTEMVKAYPDPDGARPLSNHPSTMYGVTITFHVGFSKYKGLPLAYDCSF